MLIEKTGDPMSNKLLFFKFSFSLHGKWKERPQGRPCTGGRTHAAQERSRGLAGSRGRFGAKKNDQGGVAGQVSGPYTPAALAHVIPSTLAPPGSQPPTATGRTETQARARACEGPCTRRNPETLSAFGLRVCPRPPSPNSPEHSPPCLSPWAAGATAQPPPPMKTTGPGPAGPDAGRTSRSQGCPRFRVSSGPSPGRRAGLGPRSPRLGPRSPRLGRARLGPRSPRRSRVRHAAPRRRASCRERPGPPMPRPAAAVPAPPARQPTPAATSPK